MASPPGRILIAYYDNLSKSLKAWVQGQIPEGFVELPGRKEVIADRFLNIARTSAADRLALAQDGDGKQTFRVAYADLGDGQLKFATRNRFDQPWSIETVDNIDEQGALPSLAYDKPRLISGRFESTAHLAYVGQGRRLKYAKATE
jgi:hypothetical protein